MPQRIRSAREQLKLTQLGLARELGVSIRAVQAWEYGTREPKGAHVYRLAELLEVPMETFYDDEPVAA